MSSEVQETVSTNFAEPPAPKVEIHTREEGKKGRRRERGKKVYREKAFMELLRGAYPI